jgi:hypothetical protein
MNYKLLIMTKEEIESLTVKGAIGRRPSDDLDSCQTGYAGYRTNQDGQWFEWRGRGRMKKRMLTIC